MFEFYFNFLKALLQQLNVEKNAKRRNQQKFRSDARMLEQAAETRQYLCNVHYLIIYTILHLTIYCCSDKKALNFDKPGSFVRPSHYFDRATQCPYTALLLLYESTKQFTTPGASDKTFLRKHFNDLDAGADTLLTHFERLHMDQEDYVMHQLHVCHDCIKEHGVLHYYAR